MYFLLLIPPSLKPQLAFLNVSLVLSLDMRYRERYQTEHCSIFIFFIVSPKFGGHLAEEHAGESSRIKQSPYQSSHSSVTSESIRTGTTEDCSYDESKLERRDKIMTLDAKQHVRSIA
ncbi:hypothetical protein RvY_05033 [Ramazzottius varieornatus]|uniref:Uncharacterized protein n=1 Tax=Ramazzottius varieornatus TaxID=947166 RepID=A0A1D1V2R4_RAMVA|nr:hypothetical protein RvY_05033 [Ramazzottius varieornatus]